MSTPNKAYIVASALAILVSSGLDAKPSRSPKVEIVIVSLERKDPKTTSVQWAIINHRDRAILFPRDVVGDWIYTVETELEGKTGWVTLPRDREWMHSDSDPIKLRPGETYRYVYLESNDYTFPPGFTFPNPPETISLLDKEIRYAVTYFEDEEDWQAYLNESKAPDCNWGCMEPLLKKWGHQAFSAPFKLPPAKSNPVSASPTPK